MAKRGDPLREHILYAAKDVFLEMGFERASMDAIAGRAATSKRTIYAHFESKENLYLEVIGLVRGLFLGRLKRPGDYSNNPTEALITFSGRFLETLLYARTIRMCRMCVAEADRFPEGSAQYFDAIVTTAQERLGAYLQETYGISVHAALQRSEELVGRILYPRFARALFGMDALSEELDAEAIRGDFDLGPVRKAVAELIAALPVR